MKTTRILTIAVLAGLLALAHSHAASNNRFEVKPEAWSKLKYDSEKARELGQKIANQITVDPENAAALVAALVKENSDYAADIIAAAVVTLSRADLVAGMVKAASLAVPAQSNAIAVAATTALSGASSATFNAGTFVSGNPGQGYIPINAINVSPSS